MVDEVLQGDYDYQDSPFKKGKRVAEKGAAFSQPQVDRSSLEVEHVPGRIDRADRADGGQEDWLKTRL